jgi:hypothetical protein
METRRYKRHVTRVIIEGGTTDTHAAVCLAVDTEVMQVLVASGKGDL